MPNLTRIWTRPALVIFTEEEPIPSGIPNAIQNARWSIGSSGKYLYLTDDNRSGLQTSVDRIEYKKRMINGRMRSYHISDKKNFTISWSTIPSRSTFVSEVQYGGSSSEWAGGSEMLKWHEEHQGSFYMMLVYDYDFNETYNAGIPVQNSVEYYNVFFEDFSYTVNKRGGEYDLWDVNMTLVEA